MRDVSFSYTAEKQVLNQLNCVFRSNQITAIVGPSGYPLIKSLFPRMGHCRIRHARCSACRQRQTISKIAFTLIELMIVVAIIAILAAIAVPNFMEAQMRAKIAHTRNDLRVLDTALNSYCVDYNKYPFPRYQLARGINNKVDVGVAGMFELTTPTAYLSSMSGFRNLFTPNWTYVAIKMNWPPIEYVNYDPAGGLWGYMFIEACPNSELSKAFCICVHGPAALIPPYAGPVYGVIDMPNYSTHPDRYIMVPYGQLSAANMCEDAWASVYDPTNGTMSAGTIFRFGGEVQGPPQ